MGQRKPRKLIKPIKLFFITLALVLSPAGFVNSYAQELNSTNYRILDPTTSNGGGSSDSGTGDYSLLQDNDQPLADERLESGSYAATTGFPGGIQAGVPTIDCAETNTNSGTTNCQFLPSGNGMVGECGAGGCYDRAKLEINPRGNPIDTLYLVRLVESSTNTTYYLKFDHTLATTYTIVDYQSICSLQGRDDADPACADSGEPAWNEHAQRYNITGLGAGKTYAVSVRALSGDFTETEYSPATNITTTQPTLSFDLDTGTTSGASNAGPYTINLSLLNTIAATTAVNRIWMDVQSNAIFGSTVSVHDLNEGLLSGSDLIPSEAEDLAADPNNNGGFGLKTGATSQAAFGPLIAHGNFDTSGEASPDYVGNLTTSAKTVFYTQFSGLNNRGQIDGGRGEILVKARSSYATPSGIYSDLLTFTMIGSF